MGEITRKVAQIHTLTPVRPANRVAELRARGGAAREMCKCVPPKMQPLEVARAEGLAALYGDGAG